MKQLIIGLALGLSASALIVAAQETTTHDMNGMAMAGVMTPPPPPITPPAPR